MSRARRGLLLAGGLIAAVGLIAAAGLWWYVFIRNPFNDARFLRGVWLTADNTKAKYARGPMAEDLRQNHLKVGMLRKDVRHLLGEPDNGRDEERQNVDRYYLGIWGYMSWEGDYLLIYYNKAGRVTSSEIIAP